MALLEKRYPWDDTHIAVVRFVEIQSDGVSCDLLERIGTERLRARARGRAVYQLYISFLQRKARHDDVICDVKVVHRSHLPPVRMAFMYSVPYLNQVISVVWVSTILHSNQKSCTPVSP